jgi:hypothetical protein
MSLTFINNWQSDNILKLLWMFKTESQLMELVPTLMLCEMNDTGDLRPGFALHLQLLHLPKVVFGNSRWAARHGQSQIGFCWAWEAP